MMRAKVGLLATLLLAGLSAGCANDELSLLITSVAVPDVEESCSVSPEGSTFLSRGVTDFNLRGTYTFTPVVESALFDNLENPNDNWVYLDKAITTIVSTGSADSDKVVQALGDRAAASRPLGVPLGPADKVAFAFLGVDASQASIIDGATQGIEFVDVFLRVEIRAKVVGTDSVVRSPPYEYPLTFCRGCLTEDLGPCSGLPAGFMGKVEGPGCFGQDTVFQCCESGGTDLLCPALGTSTP